MAATLALTSVKDYEEITVARPDSSRATGTLNGEQET